MKNVVRGIHNLVIITENFIKPWGPNDLEDFLGGSQECVVLLAEALNRNGFNITVYTVGPVSSKEEKRHGIKYLDYSEFNMECLPDHIILFKINPLPEDERLKFTNIIYWSSDVEKRPTNKYIKKYVCLTNYHKERVGWEDSYVIPHGIDMVSLIQNKVIKTKNTMLYCSSLDRGLSTVLDNWEKIKEKYPDLKLYITYGFKIAKQINPSIISNEEKLKKYCQDLDINYLGNISKDDLEQLYWRCQYWVLPLNNADSELFCFNAIKSQHCGCIPVVYKKGALTETVGCYIDFDDFVKGENVMRSTDKTVPKYTWDFVVSEYWLKLLS